MGRGGGAGGVHFFFFKDMQNVAWSFSSVKRKWLQLSSQNGSMCTTFSATAVGLLKKINPFR